MPDATITSTASTFGTISGTFAADQSTVTGTVTAIIPGTLSGSVGVPGPQGPAGATGPQGEPGPAGVGVPVGGTAGQVLAKVDGVDYNTEWVNVDVSAKRDLTDYDFTNVAATPLATFGLEMEPNISGFTSDSALDFQSLELQGDSSSGGSQAGSNFYTYLYLGGIYNVIQSWTLDGEGALVTDGPFGFYLTQSGLTFTTSGFTPAASTMQYGRTSITFPNSSVQTIAFPGFNNAALTGNPTAPTAALGDNDTSIATTAFVQQELLSGTANAKNLEVYVRNQTGSTLAAGTIVYVNGATGNRPTVTPAQANNDANSAQTIGFVKTSIANNGFGYVIVRGELENINTSALTEGVQLYLSPTTAGTWTTTKPSAPQHLVYVGIVIRSHPTLGVILVSVQNGYELNELHDVQIVTPTNGQVLKYDAATNLWKNQTDSVGAVTSVAGRTGAVVLSNTDISGLGTMATATATDYLSKAGNLSGLANLTTARNNLGLGAATPVQFGNVSGISGSQAPDQNYLTYSVGFPGYSRTLEHRSENTAPPGEGDNSFIDVTKSAILDLGGLGFTDYTFSSEGVIATQKTIALSLSSLSLAMNDGTASCNLTQGALYFNDSFNGSSLSIEPNGGLVVNNGSSVMTYAPTGITFPDNTVQTTAAVSFDPTGYATELWVTSQGYLVSGDLTGYATESWVTSQGYLTSAPVTSVAGKTGAVTLAVADVSGAAPTDSPTFTGTPSLPTGTTAVTQAAGNNTTAVATTAFVQQEVPDFATAAQLIATSSTTTVLSPKDYRMAGLTTNIWAPNYINLSTVVLGTGASVGSSNTALSGRIIGPNAATAGYASRAFTVQWPSNSASLGAAYNYSTESGHSVRVYTSFWASTVAGVKIRGVFGRQGGGVPVPGTLVARAYGWEWDFSTKTMSIIAHNGTALTTTSVSWTPIAGRTYEITSTSNGAGTISLYADGALLGTSSGGPTGLTAGVTWWQIEIQNESTAGSQLDIYPQNPKVYTTNG